MVIEDNNENILKASANIPNLEVTTADLFNVGEIVSNKNVVISKNAIKRLEEVRI